MRKVGEAEQGGKVFAEKSQPEEQAGQRLTAEAARRHGVRRIVFASSNHVTGFYRQDQVISPRDPARPDGFYGLSKAFGENLAGGGEDDGADLRGQCLAGLATQTRTDIDFGL